jgi:hypothetical protein
LRQSIRNTQVVGAIALGRKAPPAQKSASGSPDLAANRHWKKDPFGTARGDPEGVGSVRAEREIFISLPDF